MLDELAGAGVVLLVVLVAAVILWAVLVAAVILWAVLVDRWRAGR